MLSFMSIWLGFFAGMYTSASILLLLLLKPVRASSMFFLLQPKKLYASFKHAMSMSSSTSASGAIVEIGTKPIMEENEIVAEGGVLTGTVESSSTTPNLEMASPVGVGEIADTSSNNVNFDDELSVALLPIAPDEETGAETNVVSTGVPAEVVVMKELTPVERYEQLLNEHKDNKGSFKKTEYFFKTLVAAEQSYGKAMTKLAALAFDIKENKEDLDIIWRSIGRHVEQIGRLHNDFSTFLDVSCRSMLSTSVKDFDTLGYMIEKAMTSRNKVRSNMENKIAKLCVKYAKAAKKVSKLEEDLNISTGAPLSEKHLEKIRINLAAARNKLDLAREEERLATLALNDHEEASVVEYSKVNSDLDTADEYRRKCILAVFHHYWTGSDGPVDGTVRALETLKSTVADLSGGVVENVGDESDAIFDDGESETTGWVEDASMLPATDPAAVKVGLDEDGDKIVSWLSLINTLAVQVFVDLRDENVLSQRIIESMNKVFSKTRAKRPGFIDTITVETVTFQKEAVPEIMAVRTVELPRLVEGEDISDNATIEVDVMYRGNVRIDLTTQIFLNWPMPKAAAVPVSVTMTLVELQGTLRIGLRNTDSWITFAEEPYIQFSINSSFGHTARLKNMPTLTTFLLKLVKNSLTKLFVFPAVRSYPLLWPPHRDKSARPHPCSWPCMCASEVAKKEAADKEVTAAERETAASADKDGDDEEVKGGVAATAGGLSRPGTSPEQRAMMHKIAEDAAKRAKIRSMSSTEDLLLDSTDDLSEGVELVGMKPKVCAGVGPGGAASSCDGSGSKEESDAATPSSSIASSSTTKRTFERLTTHNFKTQYESSTISNMIETSSVLEFLTPKENAIVLAGSGLIVQWQIHWLWAGPVRLIQLVLERNGKRVRLLSTPPITSVTCLARRPRHWDVGLGYRLRLMVDTEDRTLWCTSHPFTIAPPRRNSSVSSTSSLVVSEIEPIDASTSGISIEMTEIPGNDRSTSIASSHSVAGINGDTSTNSVTNRSPISLLSTSRPVSLKRAKKLFTGLKNYYKK